ncbi:MAG: hypothetical protein P794_09295 [Epsilonproteobacteria bacterium (ex Lamellibrachia satsuma)]|nr:MAG: hypothetical protein P794_09295 [Epsilonproteobacteria bacterium (ex Lamellibrachia satsuma)]
MRIYDMDKKCYTEIQKHDNPLTKIEQLSDAMYCYKNSMFKMVYDATQPALVSYINSLDTNILDAEGMQWLYFTSGTTGVPTGVFKTKENSHKQAMALIKTFGDMKFNRVVTTVPFVHIYGIDIGGVVPMVLDIDVWTKENFLPEELVKEAEVEGTLVVTTPVFIKALNRMKNNAKFSKSLFLTSTAPVPIADGREFYENYDCSVLQLFASTETGLMGYKKNDESILKAYDGVKISQKDGMLRVSSPFVTQKIISDGRLKRVESSFQTEDIVEILSVNEFKLLGRSSKLVKIAGKRVSTVQVEDIIESIGGVDAVFIKIRKEERALKDEILDIYVEGSLTLEAKTVKECLKEALGSLHIPFKIYNHKKILRSSVGKKIGFK